MVAVKLKVGIARRKGRPKTGKERFGPFYIDGKVKREACRIFETEAIDHNKLMEQLVKVFVSQYEVEGNASKAINTFMLLKNTGESKQSH